MASASRVVVHEYKTTFLLWLVPMLTVLGCMLIAVSVGSPLIVGEMADASSRTSIRMVGLAGIGMPVLALALWLLIPAITTTYDASQKVVRVEHRWPLGRSVKEFRVDEIADFRPLPNGQRTRSLHMILKSGKQVRLEHRSTSDVPGLLEKAARIKQAVGLEPEPREIRL